MRFQGHTDIGPGQSLGGQSRDGNIRNGMTGSKRIDDPEDHRSITNLCKGFERHTGFLGYRIDTATTAGKHQRAKSGFTLIGLSPRFGVARFLFGRDD